jgi:maltose O-acetyltransferase
VHVSKNRAIFSNAMGTAEKLYQVFRAETRGLRPSIAVFRWIDTIASNLKGTTRASLLRKIGVSIGSNTEIGPGFHITAESGAKTRLVIGANCNIGPHAVLDVEERIEIGDNVEIGPHVMILTSSHELGGKEHRAGPVRRSPVKVGPKVVIGSRVIILPGVIIGTGAIVEDGSVVAKDVADGVRVRGNPAAPVKEASTDAGKPEVPSAVEGSA